METYLVIIYCVSCLIVGFKVGVIVKSIKGGCYKPTDELNSDPPTREEDGMSIVTIYRFQLDVIKEALRLTANIYECRKGETCFDRQVRQAEKYANNALEGKKDEEVKYM